MAEALHRVKEQDVEVLQGQAAALIGVCLLLEGKAGQHSSNPIIIIGTSRNTFRHLVLCVPDRVSYE